MICLWWPFLGSQFNNLGHSPCSGLSPPSAFWKLHTSCTWYLFLIIQCLDKSPLPTLCPVNDPWAKWHPFEILFLFTSTESHCFNCFRHFLSICFHHLTMLYIILYFQILGWLYLPISYILEKLEAILPSNLLHQLSRVWDQNTATKTTTISLNDENERHRLMLRC